MGSPPAVAATTADEPTVAVTENEARVLARRSGHEVEVAAFRSETSEVYVNPDGSLSQIQHTRPVRARQEGKWVKVDPTLIVDDFGRIRPKAAVVDLTLSGGGREPLATLKHAGKRLTLGWKSELPRPSIEGDTATYAEVLPGVDLQARSTVDGFAHVLVVKTREAAANPELVTLRYSLQAAGMSVKNADGADQVRFVDQASGGTVFEAPTPTMWDSSTSDATPVNQLSQSTPSTESLDAGPAPSEDDPANAQSEQTASAVGPGEESKVADLPMSVQDNQMALVPDQKLLTGADTQYPVYIDPLIGASQAAKWSVTDWYDQDATFPQFNGWANQGVGHCDTSMPKCNNLGHLRRMHFLFPFTKFSGKTILSAQLQVYNSYSTECEPDRFVDVWWTNTFDATLTWKKQNVAGWWKQKLDTQGSAYGGGKKCPGKNMEFNVTAGVKAAAAAKLSSMGIGLRATNENNTMAHKWFSDDAYLRINYNSPPNQPDQSKLSMNPGGACVYSPATAINSSTPSLSAVLTDPDGRDEQIKAEFGVAWDAGDGTGNKTRWKSGLTKAAASGSLFQVTIPAGTIPQNKVISWYVTAYDTLVSGPPSYDGDKQTSCYFTVDTSMPAAPTVTSTDYPAANPADPDDKPHGGVGKPGAFTIQPASNDAVKYWIAVNATPSAANEYKAATPGAPLTVSLLPTQVGPNVVRVKAINAAGTGSAISEYSFLVGPGSQPTTRWKMDEASGTQLADAAGTLPATVKGGVTFGQPGTDGQALTLNGTDGHAVVNGPVLDSTKSFTVAGWAKLDTLTQHGVIISGQGNRVIGWRIGFRYDTKQWFMSMTGSDTDVPAYPEIRSTVTAQAGAWTHVAGVYDALAQKMRLYVNGVKQGELAQAPTWNPTLATVIGNGRYKGNIYDWWRGKLDDIRAYDRVVTDEEMRGLYNADPVLTGRWKLNAATATTPKTSPDDTSNGRPLQLGDNAGITTSAPILGTGSLTLDGGAQGTGDWAATSTPAVDTGNSFTLAGWATAPANPTQPMTVFSTDGTTNGVFALRYIPPATADANGTWRADMYDKDATGSVIKSAVHTDYQPGEPQHLAVTYDAATGQLSLYVEGRLDRPDGTCSGSVNCAAPTFTTTGGLQIGRSKSAGLWGQYFSGTIDDLWSYQGVATAATIQQLANRTNELSTYPPAELNTWLEFGEGDGTTANDSSGHDNHATLIGGVTWLQDDAAVGTAITLNGTDGYVQTQGPVAATDASFTVAAWARLSSDAKSATLISQDGTSRSGMQLQYSEPAKRWAFTLPAADTDTAATTQVLSVAAPTVNKWAHLAGVYDATSRKIVLYVNGQPQGSVAVTPAWKARGPLAVGRAQLNGAAADFWPGDIDEARVYQGVVDEEDIKRRYDEGEEAARPAPEEVGSQNLILDPGFEEQTTDTLSVPWDTQRTPPIVRRGTGQAHSGNNHLRLEVTSGDDGSYFYQDIPVKAHTLYRYSAWARSSGAWGYLGVNGNGTYFHAYSGDIPTSGEYQRVEVVFDSGDSPSVRLYASSPGLSGTDWVEIDDMSLTVIGPAEPPVAAWTLDESSGTVASDSSGNGHDAALAGAATWSNPSGSLVLDGSAGTAAQTSGPAIDTSRSFSMAAWVTLDRNDRDYTAISQDGANGSSFKLQYNKAVDRWAFTVTNLDGESVETQAAYYKAPTLGQKTHLVGVYDANAGEIRLSVDGHLPSSGKKSGITMWNATGPLALGRAKRQGNSSDWWAGTIIQAAVYSRALHPEEASQLYQVG